jgi:hypothetical protein
MNSKVDAVQGDESAEAFCYANETQYFDVISPGRRHRSRA